MTNLFDSEHSEETRRRRKKKKEDIILLTDITNLISTFSHHLFLFLYRLFTTQPLTSCSLC